MDDIRILARPAIAGLSLRHYQGEQDLPAMLDVFLSLNIQDHENILESLDDIANKYRHVTNCNPLTDVLIAEIDQRMLAYSRVHWHQLTTTGECAYSLEWWVRPEWQNRGLEKTFLDQGQARLRQIARQQQANATASAAQVSENRLFEVDVLMVKPELSQLLEGDGFRAVRWFAMMTCSRLKDVPDYPLPAGLEVRPAEPGHYCRVWGAMLDGFRDDPGYSEPTEEDYTGWQHSSQFQPGLWQVAWDGDQVAGIVLNYVTHDLGDPAHPALAWTEDICVGVPWRRRGLARALLARSMRMFYNKGFTQTSLGVDLDNAQHAPTLYESMGYQVVRQGARYHKPFDL